MSFDRKVERNEMKQAYKAFKKQIKKMPRQPGAPMNSVMRMPTMSEFKILVERFNKQQAEKIAAQIDQQIKEVTDLEWKDQ